MFRLNSYPVNEWVSVESRKGGVEIGIWGKWIDGEDFMLLLPTEGAAELQVRLQGALGDAMAKTRKPHLPLVAEALVLQASPVPGQDILTVRLAGGLNLNFQVPQGYEKGILRAPGKSGQPDAS